jgi:hypothetical protein
MAKFKTNLRLVKGNRDAQIKETINSISRVVLILSQAVYIHAQLTSDFDAGKATNPQVTVKIRANYAD